MVSEPCFAHVSPGSNVGDAVAVPSDSSTLRLFDSSNANKPLDELHSPVVQAYTPMERRALINLVNWWWRGERLGLPGTYART